jgi:RNA polymerase sigma-70 factor (ECF subfamily)
MESFQINKTIELCKLGDREAFRTIVLEYQQLVYSLAFKLLCNEQDAEDAAQDTFVKVWQNINLFNKKYKFSTWIYKITTHICFDKLRQKKNILNIDIEDYDSPSEENREELLHNKELKKLIVKLTECLSPKQKLIFTLSDLEDLKVEEIKQITGISAAKIKSNLYLARKYIKSKIMMYEK